MEYRVVDVCFLCAGYAGAENTLKPQDSRTRMKITGFFELQGIKLKRTEMNSLATYGVTILTQITRGTDIIVRHGLTTDMSSVQTRETSIQDIVDYCSKEYRAACELYIGKYNITADLIQRISGTLNSVTATLKTDGIILGATIMNLAQDFDNPDSLIISMKINVPYPCNYIIITMAI